MDELATAAGLDPLEFRLRHLEDGRLKAVLEAAAERFGWKEKVKRKDPAKGIGLACGTEKGSYVAACVEAHIDPKDNIISVTRVCEVFECGPVLNPSNLLSQVQGQIMMALGPALREEIVFEDGVVQNASFRRYHVPRFSDLPEMDISFLERNDLDPAGGGETPIIPVAPAIANAVYHATGKRLRKLPLQVPV
jgi:isoquinoline 1-oxidoreductase